MALGGKLLLLNCIEGCIIVLNKYYLSDILDISKFIWRPFLIRILIRTFSRLMFALFLKQPPNRGPSGSRSQRFAAIQMECQTLSVFGKHPNCQVENEQVV